MGLFLLVFIVWMSLSGMVLNHPELIRNVSAPHWLIPPQYRIENWNRGALRTAVFSERDPNLGFLAGSQGVWRTRDGGMSFERLAIGFPVSEIGRQTSSLFLDELHGRLIAGTRDGLFTWRLGGDRWSPVVLPVAEARIYKLLRVGTDLLIVTPSHLLRWPLTAPASSISVAALTASVDPQETIPLVQVCFDLHSGRLWGLGGRLLFDFAGVVLIFLSLSAAYLWYWPWKVQRAIRRRQPVKGSNPLYHGLLKYHLKLGIWLAVLLLAIGGTGFFMRPPMIALLAFGRLPAELYPAPLPKNAWHDRFRNAVYDAARDRLLIEATDGFWQTTGDLTQPLQPVAAPAPVFVMGTTVMESEVGGRLLVGSFSGLLQVDPQINSVVDVLTGQDACLVSRIKPAETMVAGYFELPDGEAFVVDHYRGLLAMGGKDLCGRFQMPTEMVKQFRLPLWNFLFELHNGRIFRDLIGPWYALILPLSSLLFVLMICSGVYDWFFTL